MVDMETADPYGEESLKPMKVVYGDGEHPYSLEYESSDIGVKESIILEGRPENPRFSFKFQLEGLEIRKNPADEGFTFYDKTTGDIVGGIEAPYMNDASGEAYSEAVSCSLEEKEGEADTYLLTVVPEPGYLDSPDRVYPVIIDPTVTWADSTKMKEAYVCKGSPTTNYYSSGVTVLSVGNSTEQGLYRTFMKFDGIKTDYVSGKYVESAKLDLYETGKCAGGEYVQAHRATGNWAAASLNWNNQPGYASGSYYSRFKTAGTAGAKHTLDLTGHARELARGDALSYGIMLRAAREGTEGFYTQFYGSRYATAAKRPKLTVVYYDAPSKPDSVQTDSSYYKTGSSIQVSWGGISSRALAYVQYKVMYLDDSTGQTSGDYIGYSSGTKIGTAASGTATLPGSSGWPAGCYRIWVRGVDKSGVAGEARSWNFHIDGTAPAVGGISITPSGYTSATNPVLSWSGATDKHLKEVQYQVGSSPYVRAGAGASGSVALPSSYFWGSGTYTVRVRAVDQAGNASAAKSVNYQVDITPPSAGTLASVPAAGQWTENGNPTVQFKNITELHSGITSSGVSYCITEAGKAASVYKAAPNVKFTSAASPYAGSFTMASVDQDKADGAYTIHVRIQDKVGNAVLHTLSYKRDRTAPTGTLSYSQEKGALHDTVQITTDCKDGTGSGIKKSSLVLKDSQGGTAATVYSNYTAASVTKALDTASLKNGEYQAVLTIEDNAGHQAEARDTVTIQNRLPAPEAQGSIGRGSTGSISWKVPSTANGLREIQYMGEGDTEWQKLPGSMREADGSYMGSGNVVLSERPRIYPFTLRAVDSTGLPGQEATVLCVVDRTAPTARILSMDQGVVKGTVQDAYLSSWRIMVREKGTTAYKTLHSGTYGAYNAILYIVNIGGEEYKIGHTYEFLLEAADKAGNTGTSVYEYTKKEGDSMAVKENPAWFLEYPSYLKTSGDSYALPQNTNYLELKPDTGEMPAAVEWYIDGTKIAAGNQHPGKPWILDFYKIKGDYAEGTEHTVLAKCTSADGKVTYSVPEYKNMYSEYLPVTQGTVKTLHFQEPLTGFSLDYLEKQGGTGGVACYACIGTGPWKAVEPGREYTVSGLFGGKVSTGTLSVKAVWGSSCPGLEYFRFSGNTVTPETFSLSEMNNYVPAFLSAVSKINYKTYITWNRAREVDTADITKEKEVEIPEGVSYEIYRATSEEELQAMAHPSVAGIKDDYYSEININYSREFYYRIRAVKTEKDAATGKETKKYSNFSRIFSANVADGNEYSKFLGAVPFYSYEDFSTPNGYGSIEKARGNFNYMQTDAAIPNRKLPVDISRAYNSQSSTTSSMGAGWNHSFDLELLNINKPDELLERFAFKDETGSIYLFQKLPDGSYASSMGKYLSLKEEKKTEDITIPAKNGNRKVSEKVESAYTMLSKDNQEYRFNSGGQLVYTKEPNGSFVFLKYDEKTGRLVSATTNQNLAIHFKYADGAKRMADGLVQHAVDEAENEARSVGEDTQTSEEALDMGDIAGRKAPKGVYGGSTVGEAADNLSLVREIILPDGGSIAYTYGQGNRLLKVARKEGGQGNGQVSYSYGYGANGKLSTIYDALGNPYEITYKREDGLEKVQSVTWPETAGGQRSTKFTYRKIQEGEMKYETLIQQGVNGVYGCGELVKSSDTGNMLYNKDEKGAESTYTYEDNQLKATALKSEYQELSGGTVVTKEGVRTTGTEYGSDVNDNPISETDEEGNTVTYEYANQENEYLDDFPTYVLEVEDGIHTGEFSYEYDENGNELLEADSVTGDSVETAYYGEGSEFSGEIKCEVEKTRVYAEDGQAVYKITTRDYQYSYDSTTGVQTETATETTDGKAVTEVYQYDRMGNLVYYSDGLGAAEHYSYDFLGRLTRVDSVEGGIASSITNSYDANGTLVTATDRDGTVTEYTYDADNRVTSQKVSKGGMSRTYLTSYAYEWQGEGDGKERIQVVTSISPGQQTAKSYYNVMGWNFKNIASGICTETEFDRHGEAIVQRVGAADGTGEQQVALTLYDNSGNPSMTVLNPVFQGGQWKATEDSVVESSTYDKRGNMLSETDGRGNRTEFAYDELSRLVKVTLDDGTGQPNVTQYAYDIYEGDGTVSTQTTNALGYTSKEYVDGEGRTVKTADLGDGTGAPLATSYRYDQKGNRIQETYANGDYKTYEYDGRNRLTKVTYFKADGTGTLETKYTYDFSDQVLSMEDFEVVQGKERRYRYTGYEYDSLKQLTGYIEYDGGEIPTDAQKDACRVSFSYDNDGKLVEIQYSQAENSVVSLQYQYDGNNRIEEIYAGMQGGGRNLLRAYRYTPDGKVSEIRDYRDFASGNSQAYVRKSYTYDALGRVTGMVYTDSTGGEPLLESYLYTYDKGSNILTERIYQSYFDAEGGGVQESRSHTYDELGRLTTTETRDFGGNLAGRTEYTYDKMGNRLTETKEDENKTIRNTYNSLGQMTASRTTVRSTVRSDKSYRYDANGNLIGESDRITKESTDYSYDVANRLVWAVKKSGSTATLTQTNRYNGNGQRIQKTEAGQTTNYYYQGDRVLYTTRVDGSRSSFNLYGLEGNVIASGRYAGSCAGQYLTYQKDLRGSTTSLLKPDGSCALAYQYTDFGETARYGDADIENEICYTGGVYDESTGLYCLNARYYAPQDGRFTSQDTLPWGSRGICDLEPVCILCQ